MSSYLECRFLMFVSKIVDSWCRLYLGLLTLDFFFSIKGSGFLVSSVYRVVYS